jgi:hypothetical protein
MIQEFLMLADRAEAANGKIFIHGGGVDRHLVNPKANPPYQLNADAAFGILTDWTETNTDHVFALRIVNEDAQQAWAMEAQFQVGRPPGAKAGQQFRQLIAVRGPFGLPARGAYKLVLEIDGVEQEPPFRFWIDVAPVPSQ